jgi:hypothetical protein
VSAVSIDLTLLLTRILCCMICVFDLTLDLVFSMSIFRCRYISSELKQVESSLPYPVTN